jgi:predicted SAM-dependent methyltransferase
MLLDLIRKNKNNINRILIKTHIYDTFHILFIRLFSKRPELAAQYLKGHGIEIGALHTPQKVPSGISVKYVDRQNVAELRRHYPELSGYSFVNVDIVDDGEKLKTLKNNSQDFIIANHFIEHCEDPIGTIKNHLRILKPQGILFMAVPDMRYTFDSNRPLTTLDHLNQDYLSGPEKSRKNHYLDWSKYFLKITGLNARQQAQKLMESKYSIHFHVWSKDSFSDFLIMINRKYNMGFRVETVADNINEFIVVVRKIK